MDTLGKRIRAARTAAGKTQQEVADHLGIERVNVTQWEGDKHGPERARLQELAAFINTTVEWLVTAKGQAPEPTPQRERANARIGKPIEDPFSWQTIPVYGQAVGGVDGRFIFNGQKITDVIAPPSLGNVAGAYAVYVVGESMEPRYFAGETIYVHPRLPIRKGDFVVVQIKADEHSEHDKLGYVKQFVSMDDRRLKLAQYNPEKTLEFPRQSVISVHKIVFSAPPT